MTDSEEKKDSRIAFVGTEQYRADLQRAALNKGVKVQEFLEKAVEVYLKQLGIPGGPSDAPRLAQTPPRAIPANARWHQMLDNVLADPKERIGIEKNLEWAAAAVRAKQLGGPRRPAPKAKRASSS